MIEIILSIFYFILFCFIISKIALFKDNQITRAWFIGIFGVKIIASVLLTLLYTYYYPDRSTADIFKYFDDSNVMFNALKTAPEDYFKMLLGFDSNTDYFTSNYYQNMNFWSRAYNDGLVSDSHIIIRFNAFVRLFSFGHFQVHNVFINFISLIGLTLIYKTFKPYIIKKEKALFYVIFLIPSVLFWGSGLLKESVIFLGIGLLLNNLFKITTQFKIVTLLLILLGTLLVLYTKLYLLVAFSIPILGYLINHYLKTKKIAYGYILSALSTLMVINIFPLINARLDFVNQIVSKQQTFSRFVSVVETNSGFLLPELSNGLSLITYIPNALLNTLIRPFLWECNSIFVWLSAFENIIVITCIALTFIFRKKMNKAQKNIFYFCTSFVFCLFILIGLTTPVFGAIIRYKVPGLILLLIALLLIIDLEKIKIKYPFLKKIL